MKDDVKAVVSAALFLALAVGVVGLDLRPLAEGGAPRLVVPPALAQGPEGREDARAIAGFVFGPFALPLIVLSAALLVALVGAIVLARPERGREGG